LLQLLGAVEQHFPLVGEVAEEGALGDAGASGDVRDGRLLEAVLGVEVERRPPQPSARIRLPSSHADHSNDDSR
jgi:hypothetical protein